MKERGPFNYRLCQRAALFALTALLFVLFIRLYRREAEPGIAVFSSASVQGRSLELDSKNIRPGDVESCVWYVGDEEVSCASRLHSYTPKEGDEEQFIRVRVRLRDGSVFEDWLYYSVLPVLYLDSGTGYDDVEKEEDAAGYMRLTGEGYTPDQLYDGAITFHLRGNSTSELAKHPFKLRLEDKAELLGMEKGRHWVLLANAIDATLLRNQLVYELSRDMGADCYMESRQVTLIYNGEYCGVYQLCEQVRISEGSVDVFDWESVADEAAGRIVDALDIQENMEQEKKAEMQAILEEELKTDLSWLDTGVFVSERLEEWNGREGTSYPTEFQIEDYLEVDTLPEASGGVLLEMDLWEKDPVLKTNYSQPIYFNSPAAGETWEELNCFIRTELQALEYALHDTDFIYHSDGTYYEVAEEGSRREGTYDWEGVVYQETEFSADSFDGYHYSELIDMDSLIINFLLGELTMNYDAMKNSVFLYKDIEGLYYMGPAWDYDWAWGGSMSVEDTWRPKEWQTTSDFYAADAYYQTVQWNRCLIRDPYFLVRLQETWLEIRGTVLEALVMDGGKLDQYAQALRPAALANDARWGGSMGLYEGQTFDEGIAELKERIRERLDWLDEQFASVDTLAGSLGTCGKAETIVIGEPEHDTENETVLISVSVEESGCAAISAQLNGTYFHLCALSEGKAQIRIPESALRSDGGRNTLQVRLLDENGEYLPDTAGTVEGEYISAVSSYIWF